MRVGFDGAVLAAGSPTGVGLSFLWTLEQYVLRSDHDAVVVVPPGTEIPRPLARLEEEHERLQLVESPAVSGFVRRQLRLPILVKRLRLDLWHSPVTAVPPRCPVPVVATIHDLPWRAATSLSEGPYRRARAAIRVASRAATRILVPSEHTARDVRSGAPRCADRVQVCPLGVPPTEPRTSEPLGPFVVLGDDRPRKNLVRVRAAHGAAKELDPSVPDLLELGPHRRYVDEGEKDQHLRAATSLVHVTLHDGFGLPLLEAFARGVPVLCSDRASIPEVVGDAALLVDPTDLVAIRDGLLRMFRDRDLRARLTEAGLQRCLEFSLERVADTWIGIHRELAGGSR